MLRVAAIAGVCPDNYAFWELSEMADARRKEQWQHTSSIMCMLYSINRGKNSPKLTPKDFDPTYGGKG